MMAERNLVRTEFVGDPIQYAAPQSRTQSAHRLAGLEYALDDRIGVFLDDPVFDADRLEICRQDLDRKTGLLLVEIDGHEIEFDWRAPLEAQQHIEQRERVLAAGNAHHDAVAVLDHPVVGNRAADLASELRLELAPAAGFGFDDCDPG
jgi:hypothetical protein